MVSIYPMFHFSDEKAAASGGLFQFMRKTKNMRHKPEEEGIYLDDLNMSYVSFLRLEGSSLGWLVPVYEEDQEYEAQAQGGGDIS